MQDARRAEGDIVPQGKIVWLQEDQPVCEDVTATDNSHGTFPS
jgi:hypothetical protein